MADKAVVRGRLYVAASQQYHAFIDSRLVDRGAAFAYPGEGYYQVTDVTGRLAPGTGALGVLYHWYGPGQGRPEGEPGLLVRLVIEYGDGTRDVVVTDDTWRVSRGPWLDAEWRNDDGRDFVENVDGRIVRAQDGWASAGFDDSEWERPAVVGVHPAGVFTHLTAQLTRLKYTTVAPISVVTLESGAVVADFGKVVPATPRVRFREGTAGRHVDLVAGYLCNADGTVANTPHANQVTDLSYTYVQSQGDQIFEAFTYVGFRYLEVSEPGEITAVVQHTDTDPARAAAFASDNPTLDAVFAMMQRSALYSTQEQFLDTPTREKGQFLADAVTISRALMHGCGDRAATARAIREIAASQKRYWPDGRLNAVYPNGDGKRDIPDFTEMFPGWVWDYYVASGDAGLVAETYPVSVAVTDYVRRHRDPETRLVTRLSGGAGPYEFGIVDWPNRYGYDTGTAARTTVNMLAVDALRSTAKQAALLGLPAGEFTADADALVEAINARLRRADGVYVDGLGSGHASQIANAYAIALGVAPPEAHPVIADHLVSLGLAMGPMTADVLLTALHLAGRDDEVLRRLTDPESLGWANVLARGGTFTWESWEALDTGESMSHGWGAAALAPLQRALLGVTVTSPGGREIRICHPGSRLTRAAGTVWTQAGPVQVDWNAVTLTVEIPVNVTAEVQLPAGSHRVGSGRHTFTIRS
ncbi:family 78 glycoside hydrolase catalytic domain [Paractinoplanes rishiriensis]|uniref:family 78 glycoside hydrolase catalytic domain n=1 Tax=Paractinoplanes rishiriensis TaxID=1050105 RepID=UPI001944DE81|nr:family 78 glycoside hydrolase catalytic domain [Actinoplanes rishiriensis]